MKKIKINPKEALEMQSIDENLCVSEENENNYAIVFHGHNERLIFIKITKKRLFDFYKKIKLEMKE